MTKPESMSVLARNALWMSGGQGVRLAIQAAYFMLIARSLGVANYGAFVGVVALVGISYPFGSAGRGNLLVKNVARDKQSFPLMWGAALAATTLCGSLLIGLVLLVSRYTLPTSIPHRLVLLVAVSDIIGLNIITIAGQAFQSFERLDWTAAISVFSGASRLGGALILYSIHHAPTPLQWGYVYLGSTVVVCIMACWLVTVKLGLPILNLPRSGTELREGLYFSVSLSAQTIYNDIDKTMLARLSTLPATGVYGAAYRIIDVAFSPVSALLNAAYPNFFRKGSAGVAASLAYAKPLLKRAVAYASLVGLGLILCAGVVPYLLGPQYAQTAEAIRWLAPLLVLKAIHYFLSDALSGAGYQGVRSGVQVSVAAFNVLVNLWIIPKYSWRGAAWSSITSDAVLVLGILSAILLLSRREKDRALKSGLVSSFY